MKTSAIPFAEFRKLIYSTYEREGRSFPWKENTEPWGIFVSELMLHQTQAERVVPFWKRWMEKWPSPAALAKAPLEEVLREWSGLGYNRRAKYLKESALIIERDFGGVVPETPEVLVKLPGIGPYTAGAIACFAYNHPSLFIETNIRRVMLHFFFYEKEGISDREIMPIMGETLDRENPRKWYWALMDYGAGLKKLAINPNRRSAHYYRQNAFKGSLRQIRGSIVRCLVSGGNAKAGELFARLDVPVEKEDFYRALEALISDSLVAEEKGVYRIES